MAKIVNKNKKRDEIASSCINLFIEKGFNKPTISEIALNAKIGKGTIYSYFKNKEDIIFAIIEIEQNNYDKEVLSSISQTQSIKEKICSLFSLCIDQDKEAIKRRKMYIEFISICLSTPSIEMIQFQENIKVKYTNWLRDIFKQGIKEKKIKLESLELVDGLFATAEGVLMFPYIENYSGVDILKSHIYSLFKLIEIGDKEREKYKGGTL